MRSEEHTSELQSPCNLVCRLLLEKKKNQKYKTYTSAPTTSLPLTLDTGPPSTARSLRHVTRGFPWLCINFLECSVFFFFNDTATTEIYTLSLHDALPI